jgi:RimJ/RimL family protein N-acetyltransferase
MPPISRLFELTEDWEYFTRRDGFKASLPIILSDVVRLPYRHLKFVILARSLNDPIPMLQPKYNITIRPFEQADLEFVRQIDRPSEARLSALRLEQGHKGLMAFCDEQPAGYTWGSTDIHTQQERVHPKLCPGDFLCTDSYTVPTFRGRGVQTTLTLARFNLFRELGYTRAISTIDVHNTPSLAVWQRKLNSQIVGYIDFIRVGPWYRIQYS